MVSVCGGCFLHKKEVDFYVAEQLEISQGGHLLCRHGAAYRLHSPTLIVATVTTRTEKKKNQPTHVLVDSNQAFEEPSMILLEQIFTIDKSRIERFMGYASKAEMLRIDMALLVSLALNVLSENRSE